MLRGLLHDFNFNIPAMREGLSRPVGREVMIPLLGGKTVLVGDLPPGERERILLTLIAPGNNEALRFLLAYLSLPSEVSEPS